MRIGEHLEKIERKWQTGAASTFHQEFALPSKY